MAEARARNVPPQPPLATDIQRLLGLSMLRDIAYDPANGTLAATRVDASGTETRIKLEVHAEDRTWLAKAAGRDRLKCELRLASGEGNVRLVLLGCQGGAAWKDGAMIDLETPSFALEKLATRSRLNELGKQCAAVAHEIRQPLSTIAMASENLRLTLAAEGSVLPAALTALEHIQDDVEQARAIIDQTLNYAAGRNAGGSPLQTADLGRAIEHAVRLLAYQMEKTGTGIELKGLEKPLPVAVRQIELEQILLNIVRNGMESIEARKAGGWSGTGTIRIAVETSGTRLHCTISDNGVGLSETQRECGFQPFVTTKGDDGNGLGLYICEELLAKSGGYLRLLPGDGEGAKVEIVIPVERKRIRR